LRYSLFFGEASLEDVMPAYELLGCGNLLDRWVVRMLSMDLRHCFLHSFLLVAGQFQNWSRSSRGAGQDGHVGGYLGLFLWTRWPRGSISLRYLTMVSLRLSCLRKARPWAAQSISSNSSSLQHYFNFNLSFRGGTDLANLSSLLMWWVIVP
jgi:hypothetical protein